MREKKKQDKKLGYGTAATGGATSGGSIGDQSLKKYPRGTMLGAKKTKSKK